MTLDISVYKISYSYTDEVNCMTRRFKFIMYGCLAGLGLIILAFLIKLLFFYGLFVPLLELKGDRVMEAEIYTSFKDPGVKARYRLSDYSDKITVKDNVDLEKLGTYTITYSLNDYQKEVKRTVKVVDRTSPLIQLTQGNEIRMFEGEEYEELGYEVKDNVDQDLHNEVKIEGTINTAKAGTYVLTYTVSDKSGNIQKAERKVEVCKDPTNTKVYYNHDSFDNKMEEWWFRKSEDHQRTTGALEEDYLKQYASFMQGPKEKVIYLTFDEGGSDITYIKEIAEVLKKHDVKATYFLTRNYIKNEAEFIRELVEDGNIIGNHSWHHYDMTTLANAAGIDKFVLEITETEKTYMQVTGKPMEKVFRFPKGGSSERAMKIVQDLGYRNYFWSHAYYDFMHDVPGNEALDTMMKHYHEGAIYLLHPNNKGNFEAMDEFVQSMLDLGYRFDTVEKIQ